MPGCVQKMFSVSRTTLHVVLICKNREATSSSVLQLKQSFFRSLHKQNTGCVNSSTGSCTSDCGTVPVAVFLPHIVSWISSNIKTISIHFILLIYVKCNVNIIHKKID